MNTYVEITASHYMDASRIYTCLARNDFTFTTKHNLAGDYRFHVPEILHTEVKRIVLSAVADPTNEIFFELVSMNELVRFTKF